MHFICYSAPGRKSAIKLIDWLSPKLLEDAKILPKISILWVGRNNYYRRQTDGAATTIAERNVVGLMFDYKRAISPLYSVNLTIFFINQLEGHSVERIYLRQSFSDGSVNKTILKPRLAQAARRQRDFPDVKFRAYTISEKAIRFRHPDYDPDRAQKLISSYISRHLSTRNISSKSMHAFLSNLANRQTNKHGQKHVPPPSSEVISKSCAQRPAMDIGLFSKHTHRWFISKPCKNIKVKSIETEC